MLWRYQQVMSRRPNTWKLRARQARLTRIARIMSGELEDVGAKVEKVILNTKGKCSTDGRNVYIPASFDTGNEALELMMQEGGLAHEVAGHMRYTNFEEWHKLSKTVKAGDDDRLIHDFVNILEDARVNHLLSQDFPGSGKRLDATQAVFMQRHRAHWASQDPTDESQDPNAAIVAMMTEAIIHEPHFNTDRPQVVAYMDEVRDILHNAVAQPDTKSVIKQARRLITIFRTYFPNHESESEGEGEGEGNGGGMGGEGFGEGILLDDMSPEEIEKLAEAQKAGKVKVIKVSKARFEDMKKAQAPKPAEDAPEGEESSAGDDEADNANEADTGDDSGDSGEPSESSDDQEDGDGDDSGAQEAKEQEFDMDYDGVDGDFDSLFAELTEALESEAQQAADMEHDFKEEASDVEQDIDGATIKRHQIEVTHGTEELVRRGVEYVDEWAGEYDRTINQFKTQITTMKNELRRLIKGRNSRYTDGLKKGDLDDRRLWQHRTNSRLFKKKDTPKKAEANVLILVDASGSMGCGTRATSASECASVVTEVMDSLGFGCEVVDFNSDGANSSGYTSIRVRKGMTAPLNRITKAAIRAPFVGSQNSDGYAVQWCLDRLNKMKGNRILFVISDGQPCGPYDNAHGTASNHLKAVVEGAPKDIGLFSIGIDGMDTSKFYPNGATCNAADLTTKAMPIIRRMLRKVRAA